MSPEPSASLRARSPNLVGDEVKTQNLRASAVALNAPGPKKWFTGRDIP